MISDYGSFLRHGRGPFGAALPMGVWGTGGIYTFAFGASLGLIFCAAVGAAVIVLHWTLLRAP